MRENMLPEYTLYLDESTDDKTEKFCIAGCIVKNTEISKLDTEINAIKQIIWTPNEIDTLQPVLHSTELNIAYKNKRNPQIHKFTSGAYTVLNTKKPEEIDDVFKNVYLKLTTLIKNNGIITLCCIIDKKLFKNYYALPTLPRLLDDWYDIAMQEILECYTHFLCSVNGVGSVVYEARSTETENRTSSLDNKMFHNFCKIKVNGKGISYLTNRTIYERIRFLNIVSKKENYSGLQLADFIAFNYIKWILRNENERTDFMKRIHLAAYNGNHSLTECDLRSCWGVRIIPNDYFQINALQKELKTLRKAYDNLKTDRNRISGKLEKIKSEKKNLQEQYDLLKKENENISTQK